jgi:hypothetical protein
MKWKVGLFGVAINIGAVIWVLFTAVVRGGAELRNYLLVVPMLAASAFVVYYFIVSSYVVKRAGIQKPVFFDSLVGMLAELIIVTLGTLCYSVWFSLLNMHGKDFQAFAADLTTGILVNLLWVFAMFMVQILLVGNIAGLAGWFLMKKAVTKSLS